MDRDALVLRNRKMAEAFHKMPVKHHVRRVMLRTVAHTPGTLLDDTGVNRILLIRPDHLGDVLLATPAIRALRKACPDTEIHVLVSPRAAEVIAGYKEIDLVLTLPFPGFSRNPKESLRSPYTLLLRSARNLRLIKYNSAVTMRHDHWWGAMLAHIAGIPECVGYDLPDVAPFLTDALEYRHEHAIIRNMRLVERWTGEIDPGDVSLYFPTTDSDKGYVDGYLQEWGISSERQIFCIHPGSGTWAKRWEVGNWASVADTLIGQLDAAVVFTGGDHEVPLIRQIMSHMEEDACIVAGDTRVGQLAALYARALVVMGPASGPTHLAAAVGTPTVTLFGPADPLEFGTWGPRDKHEILTTDIGCRPCRVLDWGEDNPEYHPCVRDISVGRVLTAARRVIQT